MTNISDYLPKREKMATLQAKMPRSLLAEVKLEMKGDNAETWGEFLTALFKSYLAEKRRTKSTREEVEPPSSRTR